jgi:hypothetical protein
MPGHMVLSAINVGELEQQNYRFVPVADAYVEI